MKLVRGRSRLRYDFWVRDKKGNFGRLAAKARRRLNIFKYCGDIIIEAEIVSVDEVKRRYGFK